MGARTCRNCRFVKEHIISFDGGKTEHSRAYSCHWGSISKPKKVPWWAERYHTVGIDAPARKKGCNAFEPTLSSTERGLELGGDHHKQRVSDAAAKAEE